MAHQPLEHHIIRTNGINLHVVQSGPETGKLVIFLHGFPEFWRAWSKQIPAFTAAGFRVWAPDQRGYNLSDKPEDIAAYKLDELAADVLGLIDAAGHKKAIVIGHDWGASVAWWLGIRYPARLERLVILNIPHLKVMMDYLRRSFRQLLKSWYIFFFQIPALPEFGARFNNYQPFVYALRRTARSGTFSDQDIAAYREAWSQPGAFPAMLKWYKALLRYPPELTKNIRVVIPVLIIWGVKDAFLSREMAQPSLNTGSRLD